MPGAAGKRGPAQLASRLTERRMTLKVNVAGWVSTTSAAVSVTRSRRPVSGCPGRYCRAANGVAVESDAVTQCVPLARQVCQV